MKYTRFERRDLDQIILRVQAETTTTQSYEKKIFLFKEGCKVALRSAPTFLMTLDHFVKSEYEVAAECVWFSTDNKLCREIFNLTSLCIVTEDAIEDLTNE